MPASKRQTNENPQKQGINYQLHRKIHLKYIIKSYFILIPDTESVI